MSEDKKELDIEALIKLASQPPEPGEKKFSEHLNEARRFALDNNVKRGDAKIPAFVIYHIYLKWRKAAELKGKPLSKVEFSKKFYEIFHDARVIKNNGRFYCLEPEPFEYPEEEKWEIYKELRESHGAKEKKGNADSQ